MGSRRLRVVTLNCLLFPNLRARLGAIARELEKIAPDIRCHQEVFWRRDVPLLGARSPAFQSAGLRVMGGLVTLASSPVERSTFEKYRARLWLEWPARLGRLGFLISYLRHAGEVLTVVNTHLPANYDEDWSPNNRYASRQVVELEQLANALHQLPDEGLLVVAGDFNVPASSPLFEDFLAASGLRSAVEWTAWPPSGRAYHGIDNVLYRPPTGQQVTATARLLFQDPIRLADGRLAYASDHLGVEAELEW